MTNQALTKNFPLRLSAADHARLLEAAASCRTNASTLLRQLLCDYLDGTSLAPEAPKSAQSQAQSQAQAQPTAASKPTPTSAAAPKKPARPVKYPQPQLYSPEDNYASIEDPHVLPVSMWRWIFKGLGYTHDPVDQTTVAGFYNLEPDFVALCWHPDVSRELHDAEIPMHFVNNHVIRAHRGYEVMTSEERAIYEGRTPAKDFVDVSAAWDDPANYTPPPIKPRTDRPLSPEQVAQLDSLFDITP